MENDENTLEVELNENEINEDVEESQEDSQESEESQDKTDWKAEALKYKAILDRNKGKNKPEIKQQKQVEPALDDETLARIYNVPVEDFEEVKDWAAFKKISIGEALKSDSIKTSLATKAEFRKTAQVSNTGASRRGVNTVSDDTLLANSSKGIIPEPGSEEAERLFWAKRGGKR